MEIIREIGAVLVVFGLLGLFLFAGKRTEWIRTTLGRANRTGGRLEVLESARLGPAATIHIVRIAHELIVVAVHGGGCTVINHYREAGQ